MTQPQHAPAEVQQQTETARALLYRRGLPEDVIDAALCLHAQELAAVQRADAEARHDRSYSDNRVFELKGARTAADLIDPTRGAATPAGPGATVEARPPRTRWSVETRDPRSGGWTPGLRFPDQDQALEHCQSLHGGHSVWKHGLPAQLRIVRETTTYTVVDA